LIRYQVFTVGHDGHFAGPPIEVKGGNDQEIFAYAEKLANAFGLEIWDHKRFVARIPPPQRKGVAQRLRAYCTSVDSKMAALPRTH
jgi:hypothetical protein